MPRRDAKALDRPKMGRRNPGNAPLKLSARDEQALRYGRGGQADDTRWLPEAAAGAMQAVGTDRIARAAFGLAAKALGRAAPVFRPAPAKAGGVHVPRSAATARDAEALALYDRLLDGERFGGLPREAQLDIARRTGWQELPTGETVRQIPRFEFGPGWRRYEPFATETRAVLSGVAENEVGAVPPMTMAEAFAGDGAKELFWRYPNAKNWLVRADRAPAPRVMGFSEPGSTAVTVTDEGLMRGAEPVLNTVHHETQHVIQNMSGMSPGSTSADALAELKAGIGNALLDGRGSDPAVMRAVDALQQAMKSSDPAYHAYQHAGGEAGAFAAGNAAVEGRTGELIADAMSREGIVPENVYDLRALRQDNKGGNAGKFKGWKAYKGTKEAAAAEAAAVAFVNEGIVDAPPLSEGDLEDSRRSAAWLEANGERKGLVKEGTLSHTGRPRFVSRNGFMEGDTYFQGDRFSSTVPVDPDAQHKDPDGYARTGQWAVIPTVYPDADGVTRLHTGVDAESAYRKGGGHFGVYEGLDNANHGAEWDHHKGNAEWARRSEVRQDAKGGEDRFSMSRNFLATDKVPDTIFGIPVVSRREDYTEADIRFFQEHPEAGGYYDLGEDEEGTPENGTMEGEPVQDDEPSRKPVPILSFTRSEAEAVQALYEGVDPTDVETMRARTIRARGGDPSTTTLGEIGTNGTAVTRDGSDPMPYGSYRVEYHPGSGRSVAMTSRGVAELNNVGVAQREELTHLLNPARNERTPPGWVRRPGELLGDLYQRRAESLNGDGVDRFANYYVYGRKSEREMAMALLKQAIARNFAATGGDPVERTSGAAIIDMINGYADRKLAPGKNLPFVESVSGGGYSFHRLKADGKASLPGEKLLREYLRLYDKTKNGEPLNEVEQEAWGQLSDPDAWDRVVSVGRPEETTRAGVKGGHTARAAEGPPPPPSRGKYPGIANNPGNVEKHERRTDKTLFKGEIGGGKRPKRFANFATPVDGLNAAALTIMRRAADLAKDGKDFTIANYAPLYAPPSENDTATYTKNLSKYSGIRADEVLDPYDTNQMSRLLRNVVRFESGAPHSAWFTDDEYRAAAEAMKEGAFD